MASLRVFAYAKDYTPLGPVGGLRSVSVTWRHNLAGQASFTLDADNRRASGLASDGARAVVEYIPDGGDPVLLSGSLSEVDGSGRAATASRTFQVRDDFAEVFTDTLGWPNPAATIDHQGDDAAYFTQSGPAETVLINVVTPNATRNGLGLTIPATAGRGDSIAVQLRFHPLYDRLFPAVDQAGIGVRVVQDGDHRDLVIYEPTSTGPVLTQASGVIRNPSFKIIMPTVTRVVVAAQGEGTDRGVAQYIATDRETQYGIIREAFVDARDIALDDPSYDDLMATRGAEALADGDASASAAIETGESRLFRFGVTFHVGDRKTVEAVDGQLLDDYVREVTVTQTPKDGITVTPVIGAWNESRLATVQRRIALALKGIRDLRSSL